MSRSTNDHFSSWRISVDKKRNFMLQTIGLTDRDRTIIKTICMLTKNRARAYKLTDGQRHDAEVLIFDMNGRTKDVLPFLIDAGQYMEVPKIFISDESIGRADLYQLKRPLKAHACLRILDQVVTRSYHYAPELVIGGDADQSAMADQIGRRISPDDGQLRKSNYRALVVDDSASVRNELKIELDLLGIDAEFAAAGDEALALLKKHKFDIIFLDVVMPEKDGYAVCKEIKRDSHLKRLPVIMLTSKTSPFNKMRGSFAGCDSYITKPLSHAEFVTAVRGFIPLAAPGRPELK